MINLLATAPQSLCAIVNLSSAFFALIVYKHLFNYF